MSKPWIPITETITEAPDPTPPKTYEAVTNLPEVGTYLSATLTGESGRPWQVHGRVIMTVRKYGGVIQVEVPFWIDGHYRGAQTISLDLRLPWVIQIEEWK